VPKLYHKGAVANAETPALKELLKAIQTFVSTCRNPAVLEEGEDVMPLTPGQYALEIRSEKLWIEVWSETRSVSRRLLTIERHTAGVLDCTVQRFGARPGKISFLDLDRPQSAHRSLSGTRQSFREQFRRMLFRQFPGWETSMVSCGMDLQRSLSPVFPRARLKRGNRQIAAMACASPQDEAAMLSFALIWHDHVCAHSRENTETSFCLFLPEAAGCLTSHRLRWLATELLRARLFRFNAHGMAGEVDPEDLGNLDTRVSAHYAAPQLTPELDVLLKRLQAMDGTGCCPELNGAISIRSRGLEFARIENGRVLLGIETKQEVSACHMEEVERFAAHISSLGANAHIASPLAQDISERWLESCVRENLAAIDPSLLADPVQGQVLTFAGGDRDLIDLLAISPSGHLAVLELKAAEDIHLPLQAFDYWTRISWHAQLGELQHLFPGIEIEPRPPKLLLIAPAISFHPSNATVLRYFSPKIDVERIGINSDWQKRFRVVMRLRGAELPISHRSSE
jgi:hypothetical protein